MTDLWLGYAEKPSRREVLMALRRIAPGSAVVFAENAQELRERLAEEEPGTVGAIVGHAGEGVSDINLAAALVHDGRASEVVLVARGATGSLRSRAERAGVSRVVDATVAPALETSLARSEARRRGESAALELASPSPPAHGPVPERRPLPADPPCVQPNGRELSCESARSLPALPARVPLVYGAAGQASSGAPVPAASHAVAAPVPTLPAKPKDAAPILAVASGRGGVGKTALIALMAAVAGRWGMNVALVDLDLSCGNLHTCFGVVRPADLVRIVREGVPTPEIMGRSSVRCGAHVQLWGPCEKPEMAELVMPHVATLLSYLSTHHDVVLVDTSTTFTDGVAQAVQFCDRMIVVHDERPGAVASAARMSALAVRLGVARTRIVRVLNLANPRAKVNAFEGRAEVGLETARLYRVVDGGLEAEDLLSSGKAEELAMLDCDLVADVSTLLAQTLSELGRLPDSEDARSAAEYHTRKRRILPFGKRREAV